MASAYMHSPASLVGRLSPAIIVLVPVGSRPAVAEAGCLSTLVPHPRLAEYLELPQRDPASLHCVQIKCTTSIAQS